MNREKAIELVVKGEITTAQAATWLQCSPRQIRRIKARYREEGNSGLVDKRTMSPKQKRIPLSTVQTICQLKAFKYADFSVQHFYECLQEEKQLSKVSYSFVLNLLQGHGLVKKATRRGKYRRKRERQPMVGMRVHLDSSTHDWLGPLFPKWDLTIALDDADGRILSGRFAPQEGTMTTLQALWDVFTTYGRFQELYTDRGSHFCQISDEMQGPDKEQHTQLARVLKTLAIQHIWAHSPQARGRSERVFGTLQDRLVHELALQRIQSYDAANAYLQTVFIPKYNKRFTVNPRQEGSAFTALPKVDVHLLLSIQDSRLVHNDFTVHFNTHHLQLPKSVSPLLARQSVTVHTFLDGALGVSSNGLLLACFDAQGVPVRLPEHISPTTNANQPRPTRPQPNYRSNDFTDVNFWASLSKKQKTGPAARPTVSRNDLFYSDWSMEGGHL